MNRELLTTSAPLTRIAPWPLLTSAMVMCVRVSVVWVATLKSKTLLAPVSVRGWPLLLPSMVVSATIVCGPLIVSVAAPQLKLTNPPPASLVVRLPSSQVETVPEASAARAPQASTTATAARPSTSGGNRRSNFMVCSPIVGLLTGVVRRGVAGRVRRGGRFSAGRWRAPRLGGRQGRGAVGQRGVGRGYLLGPGHRPGLNGNQGGRAADNSAHAANIGTLPRQLLPFVVKFQPAVTWLSPRPARAVVESG